MFRRTSKWMAATVFAGVLLLGPAIRRFGTAFESDIFHSNPDTGRSFLTLMDIAYYSIFGAYTLMTLEYSTSAGVQGNHLADWFEFEAWRVGGLLVLMGLLHVMTLVVLPAVGLVFSANMRRARREELGEAATTADPRNEQVDRWITIVVWILVGLGLLQLLALVLPLIAGLGS